MPSMRSIKKFALLLLLTSCIILIPKNFVQAASYYTVKSGDSLYLISKKYNFSLYSLRRANNKWDNYIYVGQQLKLPYVREDVDVLSRLITAEAENQPYSAKVAVGAVVVNRMYNPNYPKTIYDVIYQIDHGYYQFTPVLNGYINKPATADSIRAAVEALNGSDPTNGALFYFDDSTTNTWLWSKPIATTIGKMVFTY